MTSYTPTYLIIFIIALLIQLACLFIRPKFVSPIPLIVTCVSYFITQSENVFWLAVLQAGILFIGDLILFVVDRGFRKRKVDAIDRMTIEDL